MPNKPLLLIYSDSHILGGAERYLLGIIPVLVSGWQITFVYRKDVDFKFLTDQLEKIGVRCLPNAIGGFSWAKIAKLKNFFRTQKPDLIIFNQGHFYTAKGARIAAILAKIPHIIVQHGSPFDGRKHATWLNRIFSRLTFPQALGMIVPSVASAEFLSQYFPYLSKTVVINHGVDLAIFDPNKYDRAAIKEKLKLPKDSFVLSSIGRLLPDKNPQMVLDAFSQITAQNPQTHLLFVGEGNLKDELESQANILAPSNIHFLPYSQNPAEILAASDVMILTSQSESFGLIVIEAMAMGVIPITFKVDSLPDTIGDVGQTVPYGDTLALGQAIQGLISNIDLRKNMSLKGLERVKALYDIRSTQKATKQAITDLYYKSQKTDSKGF